MGGWRLLLSPLEGAAHVAQEIQPNHPKDIVGEECSSP